MMRELVAIESCLGTVARALAAAEMYYRRGNLAASAGRCDLVAQELQRASTLAAARAARLHAACHLDTDAETV